MKGFKSIISVTIYLFFTVGILGMSRVVLQELNTGTACPKVKEIPICYVIIVCFIAALISHIINKKPYIYFVCIGFSLIVAITATVLHINGNFICPKTIIKGTPKCYYAVALLSSLLFLKILHAKNIK